MISIKTIILDFLYKYFFILKAASNGTIVSYVGGNKFEFSEPSIYKYKYKYEKINNDSFISKCSKNLPLFILEK